MIALSGRCKARCSRGVLGAEEKMTVDDGKRSILTDILKEWKNRSLGRIVWSRLKAWWRRIPPDPWPAEVDESVRGHEAVMICHHCFTPQQHAGWLCPTCGVAVGPYNNILPYIRIFSMGEVSRSCMGSDARFTLLTVTGYILLPLLQVPILAPFYYIRLALNWRKLHADKGSRSE